MLQGGATGEIVAKLTKTVKKFVHTTSIHRFRIDLKGKCHRIVLQQTVQMFTSIIFLPT